MFSDLGDISVHLRVLGGFSSVFVESCLQSLYTFEIHKILWQEVPQVKYLLHEESPIIVCLNFASISFI